MQTTLLNIYYIHSVGCKYCFNEWMADMFASSCMPSLSILVSYNKLVGYGNYADNSIYYLLYIKLCSWSGQNQTSQSCSYTYEFMTFLSVHMDPGIHVLFDLWVYRKYPLYILYKQYGITMERKTLTSSSICETTMQLQSIQ